MEASPSDCSHDCVLDKGKQMANPIVMQSVCPVDQEATCPHGRPIRIPLESQVLSLLGNVHNLPINILIDSGCTNNFVSTTLVQRLKLRTTRSPQSSTIELADGSMLQCNTRVRVWLSLFSDIEIVWILK